MSKSYKPEAVLKFRGRSYLLFRRGESERTPFSFRVQKDGKSTTKTDTGFQDASTIL
jgi:hypothetical protein